MSYCVTTMDFPSVCRTCLGTDSLNPIFNSTTDHRRHSKAIFITTGIKIQLNDGMPQQMCVNCVSRLNNSLTFRKQCKDSETKLLQLKNQDIQSENTDHTLRSVNIDHQYYREIGDIKNEDILKIELKCEFEADNTLVKSEDDSDFENDKPLSYLTEKTQSEGSALVEKKSSKKLEKNGKSRIRKKEIQRVSCPVCHKDLSARSLRAHVSAQHAGADGLTCGHCKMDCDSKEALLAHVASCPLKKKRRGSESGKELVRCEVCHKAMQRASLRAHVAVKHKGLGPVCEHCGRRFGNRLRLSEHLRAKHGYEKLRCSHCDFASASSAALQNHERRHRGEKPFVCETCGAKFHAAYLLAQHRHSHRTDKRVKCSLCGAVFAAANSLHAHRLARHGARRHRCPLCARAYACRHYAVKHLRCVHGFKGAVPPLQVDPAPPT